MPDRAWLAERFGDDPVPERDLERAREALGWEAASSVERLLNSYNSDGFVLTAGDGRKAFVRVARAQHDRFPRERVALQRCRQAGVPVPEVLAVLPGVAVDGLRPVSVLSFIAGSSLETAASDLTPSDMADVLRRAGGHLARIHRVGQLEVDGRAEPNRDELLLDRFVERRDFLMGLARDRGVPRALLSAALEALEGSRRILLRRQDLVHGDFGAKHVMVGERGSLTGIVDLEDWRFGNGVMDLAFWGYLAADESQLPRLLEGYSDEGGVEPSAHELLLQRIKISCVYLASYGPNPDTVPTDFFVKLSETLRRDLARL